jgi:hypothetical protein
MGWEWDQPPEEYLIRRLRFYKIKLRRLRRRLDNPYIKDRYTKGQIDKMIKDGTARYSKRIRQFEKAIKQIKGGDR